MNKQGVRGITINYMQQIWIVQVMFQVLPFYTAAVSLNDIDNLMLKLQLFQSSGTNLVMCPGDD